MMFENFVSVEKWPSQGLVLPRIQAHRGFCLDGAQENTLEAFRQAKAKGALMIECDVRLSKDRVPVVFHDEDLSRIAQRPDFISDVMAKDLRLWGRVPSLEEVLLDLNVPRFVNIELKSRKKLDDPLERKVAEVVVKLSAQRRVMFSSFNPMSLYRISLHLPQVPRALLVTQDNDADNSVVLKRMLLAPFLGFHCLHLEQKMVTEKNMAFWKKRQVPVAVWTIRDRKDIQKFLNMGVVSVISDVL